MLDSLHKRSITSKATHWADLGCLCRLLLKLILWRKIQSFDVSYWRVPESDISTYSLVKLSLLKNAAGSHQESRLTLLLLQLVETYRVSEVYFRFYKNKEKYHAHGLITLYRSLQIFEKHPMEFGDEKFLGMAAALLHDFLEELSSDTGGAFPLQEILMPMLLLHGFTKAEAVKIFSIIQKTNYSDSQNAAHWNFRSGSNHFNSAELTAVEKIVVVSDLLQISAEDYSQRVTDDLPGAIMGSLPVGLAEFTVQAISALQSDFGFQGVEYDFVEEIIGASSASSFKEVIRG